MPNQFARKALNGFRHLPGWKIFLSLTFFLLCLCHDPVTAAEAPEIRVGWFFSAEQDNQLNTFAGYNYEYLNAIAQFTNWRYKFVHGSFSECMQLLAEGKIDLLCYTLKTAAREKTYDYAALPAGMEPKVLVTLAGNKKYAYNDFKSFEGIRTAAMKGDMNIGFFQRFSAEKQFNHVLIICDSYDDVFKALEEGKADAAVLGNYVDVDRFAVIAKFGEEPFYFLTTKGNSRILDGLNEAMETINMYYPHFQESLYDKYTPSTRREVSFTAEELKYLSATRTFTAALDPDWAPLSSRDANGVYSGIVVDFFLQKLALDCGVMLNIVPPGDSRGNVISVSRFNFGPEKAADEFLTPPFLVTPVVEVSEWNRNSAPRTAGMRNNSLLSGYIAQKKPEIVLVKYRKKADCLDALRQGNVECTFITGYETEYYLALPRYRKLHFRSDNQLSIRLCLSLPPGSDPRLGSILVKAVKNIDSDTIQGMILKNTNLTATADWIDVLYSHPLTMATVILALCAAVALFIALLLRSHRNGSQILHLNKALTDALRHARDASDSKSNFLSRMSHDIRTPLNGIIGMTSLAIGQNHDPELAKYLTRIDQSGHFLLDLVNDILDMSRIESGKMKLHFEPCSDNDLLSNLVTVVKTLCAGKGIHFSVSFTGNWTLQLDRLHFTRIFFNLLSNAVKFTPPGGHISFSRKNIIARNGLMSAEYVVSDDGIGISEEFQRRMFMPFEQEHTGRTDERKGSGLGLAIVQSLVEAMNGTISCKSAPGKGTTFSVGLTFRIADKPAAAEHTLETVNISGSRLLLAEDNEINAEIATMMLQQWGAVIDSTENGRLALEIFSRSPHYYYDAILMDLRMPVMDGLESTRRIRSLPRPDAKIVPIVALTANAFEQDISESLAAGMNAHIAKPIDASLLKQSLGILIAEAKWRKNKKDLLRQSEEGEPSTNDKTTPITDAVSAEKRS